MARRADRGLRWLVPLSMLAGIVSVRLWGGDWVEGVQHRAFDVFLKKAPRPYEDTPVRVVDVDEESLAKIGQWPWPRTQVARLIRLLTERGAAVVAFDAMFPEPDRTSPKRVAAQWPDASGMREIKERVSRLEDHDEALARELRRSPVVLGFAPAAEKSPRLPRQKSGFGFSGSAKLTRGEDGVLTGVMDDGDISTEDALDYLPAYPGAISNLPELERAAPGLGSIGFRPEHDGIIRRAPLIFRFGKALYPSLVIEALRVAYRAKSFKVKLGGTNDPSRVGAWLDKHTGITKIKAGNIVIPTDDASRLWVYYTKERARRTIPAWKVFDPQERTEGLRGAIVFVGTSAQGLRDLRTTPLESAEDGVQIHANLTEQILLGEYLSRPGRLGRIEVAVTIAAGLLLLVLLMRLGAVWSAPVGLGMIFGAIWLSWHAYAAWHWLIDPVFPLASLAAVYASFAATGYVASERDRRKITDTFGRYLSPKVVEQLAKAPGRVELGGETREMTFHFCDIRGFTTISERFDPHGLTEFINRFLTPMTQIILDHDGTIDKYMGDCIMAFWNAPMSVPDHARKACAAALAMHAELAALNARWQEEAKAEGRDLPEIHIGTGLNTGPCVVGNMGSALRVDYTVLGDDVNLASRLEGQSKSYGVDVVIGPLTREQAPEFAALELDLIKVKGKTQPVNVFALLGTPEDARSDGFRALAGAHEALLAAYRRQDWDEAEKRLAEARALAAGRRLEKLYALYEERIARFRAEPPGAAWDGVYTALTK